MTDLLADVADFIERHRACGMLTGDATEPTERGYMLWVACPCGVVFERWVTPDEAVRDVMETPLSVFPN